MNNVLILVGGELYLLTMASHLKSQDARLQKALPSLLANFCAC